MCNNNCIFCDNKEISATKYFISMSAVEKHLGYMAEQGATSLILTGGEPTTHPELPAIVNKAVNKNFREIVLHTNGRNLGKSDLSQKLSDSGVNNVMVSLFGDSTPVHESISRRNGSFAETLEGIRAWSKTENYLCINTPITTKNYICLMDIAKLIESMELKKYRWQISDLYPTTAVLKSSSQQVEYSALKPILHETIKLCIIHNIRYSTQEIPLCILFPWIKEAQELSINGVSCILVVDSSHENGYRKIRPWSSVNKLFPAMCNTCSMKNACSGISKSYLKQYDDLEALHPFSYVYAKDLRKMIARS